MKTLLLLSALLIFVHNSSLAQTQTDIPYGSDPLQKLDYWSAASPAAPIIIIAHGGGWFTGDKSGAPYQNASQLFNNEGYAVVNINYRLTPTVTYPSHIEDITCALAWTKNNASLMNGDSSRIVIYGHSAGGQIAAYLGVRPINSMLAGCSNTAGLNVDGVILTSATVDFDMTNPADWSPIINMLGDTSLYWDVAQPTNHCANNFSTKFLILCGDLDNLWIDQDSAFHDSLIYYNHCSRLHMFTGYDHSTMITNLTATNAVFLAMTSFLDSLWNNQLCIPTGMEEPLISSFTVYPNPSSGYFTVNIPLIRQAKAELKIVDLLGKEVSFQTIKDNYRETFCVNLNLPCGIYFLQLKSDDFIQNIKLEVIK
ncbi:MAG: alpha/beta hydrolase fold domain-containing protein [Bacteroidetes bacterium]|nr:alpha/beta hydrolase fold domain-containing protein [Bacteroidota bacterium]